VEAVAAISSSAAILEGYRRALTRQRLRGALLSEGTLTLTDVVENATEHAPGLPPRLAGIGIRVDKKV
jgi:hypothetical protein